MTAIPALRFTVDDAERAFHAWGANCGPSALAAVLGKTLDEVRPYLGDFERLGYTSPALMFEMLRRLEVRWSRASDWPRLGLVRIQWGGPWMKAGVPTVARYRHTHWVGAAANGPDVRIYDVNAMSVGGWLSLAEWSDKLVPWLLKQCEPRADGTWSPTHRLELRRAEA